MSKVIAHIVEMTIETLTKEKMYGRRPWRIKSHQSMQLGYCQVNSNLKLK